MVARCDFRLGYDRPEQRVFREQLRAACRAMLPRDGSVLRAVYAHPLAPEPVDLENVLTYNVGTSCLAHVAREGFVLERAPGLKTDDRFAPHLMHEVAYHVTTDRAWGFWTAAAPLYEVLLPDRASLRTTTAKKVWASGRRGQVTVHGIRADGPLLVDVEVGDDTVGLLNLMKPLVDGLLAVGHCYCGHEEEALLARADAVEVGLKQEMLAEWLAPWVAPLGPWKFLFPRGAGLQVSPADDRIVGLRMTRTETPAVRFAVHVASAL